MPKALLIALFLCLFTCRGWSAQPSSPPSEIELSISPTQDAYMFTISLRNVSEHDLTVMLGEKCGVGSRGWKRVGIVHYTLININGAQIGFDDFGLPCSGMFGVLMQDLRPGESYSYDFDVHNTVVSENEMFFHLLNSGRELLRIQASADGQKAIDEWKGTGVDPIKIAKYPIWKGRALSESVPLAPLHAAQPHSRP